MIARSLILLGVAAVALLVSPVSTLAGRDVRGALVQSLDQQPPPCNGDEQILYFPSNPVPNQIVNTQVTSARPSVNVNLVNAPPGNIQPVFRGAGPGGKGTIWYYNITPPFPGRYDYNFFVGPYLCTTNFFITQGGVAPTPVPNPPPSGGISWQTSATPVTHLSETNNIQITVRNASGVPGQQVPISIIVSGPLGNGGGPATSRNLVVYGADLLTVPYPQGFPGGAPLKVGQYHIEWTDRGGNDFASTYVQVVN